MYKGHIEYYVEIRGIQFEKPIEFKLEHPAVEKVILEPKETDKINLKFHITNVQSTDDARNIAQDLADGILEKLAFFFTTYVGTPYFLGAQLTKETTSEDGSTSFDIVSMLPAQHLKADAHIVYTPSLDEVENLIKELQDKNLSGTWYSAFRFAMLNPDPVARFMAFYNILLQINNDSQRDVDKCISSIEPSVLKTPRPDKPFVKETVYTRLRNELAHPRAGTNLKETRKEIEQKVNHFKSLVKEAIQRCL